MMRMQLKMHRSRQRWVHSTVALIAQFRLPNIQTLTSDTIEGGEVAGRD